MTEPEGSKGSSLPVRLQFKTPFFVPNPMAPAHLNSPFSPPSTKTARHCAASPAINAISWNSKYYGVLHRGGERSVEAVNAAAATRTDRASLAADFPNPETPVELR
jgi:hypothetical protein